LIHFEYFSVFFYNYVELQMLVHSVRHYLSLQKLCD